MNRKIFTLLVGAIILIGSAFTVNAQGLQYTYKGNNSPGVDSVNFKDMLTATAVANLPATHDELPKFYYLLSVTGIANTSRSSAAIQAFANRLDASSNFVLSIDDHTTGVNQQIRRLRVENLATLDTLYSYNYNGSHKFGALRRSLWCLDYYLGTVTGSNISYDFTNVETGFLLQAPWQDDRDDKHRWEVSADDNLIYRPWGDPFYGMNSTDDDYIVNGWHFSQTYGAQTLQVNMPIFSYTSKDSVLVFVLDDEAVYDDPVDETAITGGWPVTVKHVAVADLIRDAAGNMHDGTVTYNRDVVRNVLRFTIKKVNKFVMNANDWNSINMDIEFNKNANVRVFNEIDAKNADYINPFLDIDLAPLVAYEVHDSLYHYGYMQFQSARQYPIGVTGPTRPKPGQFLYVDTAWVNWGNNTYLAFAWGPRRDSTSIADDMATFYNTSPNNNNWYNWMGWGASFVPSNSLYMTCASATGGILDKVPYMAACADIPAGDVYWRMDSIFWAIIDTIVSQGGSLEFSSGVPYILGPVNFNFNAATPGSIAAKYFEIMTEYTTVLGGSTAGLPGGIGGYLFNEPASRWVEFLWNGTMGFIMGTHFNYPRQSNYTIQRAIYDSYGVDSLRFIYSYMQDSIMENQSKFRVVYDPFADSTFINVYQTRVKYPNYENGSHNQTWPYWWENSFGKVPLLNAPGRLPGINATNVLRPSDLYTQNVYGVGYVGPAGTQRTITEAAAYYFNTIMPQVGNQSDAVANMPIGTGWQVEGHGVPATGNLFGERAGQGPDGPSIFNFHSFMQFYPQSSIPGIDRVLISTADTVRIFNEFGGFAGGNFGALSHMYGWSLADLNTTSGWLQYRDSLLYIDLQNLESPDYTIITLDQSYKDGIKQLDTQIKINFGTKCVEDDDLNRKATIDNDLYLIRNTLGQYLTVPLWSITDSVYWVTPAAYEDLTKMPCYQWAIINLRQTEGSPFRMINREFERVEYPYVYVYKNQIAPFVIAPPYSRASFNNRNVVGMNTPKDKALAQGEIDPAKFVTNLETRFPLMEVSFIRLGKTVKEDHLLGYLYIDKDATYIDVYAFKFLHFYLGCENPRYLNWRGYNSTTDSILYTEGQDYYDKLYFHLQEMTEDDIFDFDPVYNQGLMVMDDWNTANSTRINWEFRDLYLDLSTKDRLYTNADQVVMERFGFWESNTGIADLKPLARQAYRLFLQDYYRWHPTEKGHYVTVGGNAANNYYVLSDKANASRSYVRGTGDINGLFGIPHFYFRNTYFDVCARGVKDDYFAIVQRIDTARINPNSQDYFSWGVPKWGDIEDYFTLIYGNVVAQRMLHQIQTTHELGLAVLDIDPAFLRAKFVVRADKNNLTDISAFQLERDEDPIYRRFHVNEPDHNFYPEMGDKPDTLEFHLLNSGERGYKLFENSGNYLGNDPYTNFGKDDADGGRIYNRDKDGQGEYLRDSITIFDPLGNVISFLGANNSVEYPNTNRAIYVDTAYINRGTGWIKPQYMLVVDPYNPSEPPYCQDAYGWYISPNEKYVIGRYLFNTAMYSKAIQDSILDRFYDWDYTNHIYSARSILLSNRTGYYSPTGVSTSPLINYYMFSNFNFNKVEPIKESVIRTYPNGKPYTWDGKWERLAFTWAIHKGDSLYVLKGLEPGYQKDWVNDPIRLFEQLKIEYGGGWDDKDKAFTYVDFNRLIAENSIKNRAGTADSLYYEAYWPLGDRTLIPELRPYRTFRSMEAVNADHKTIGLQAIIDLSDNTHKDWVFSFRYVERGSSDFVIESETAQRDIRNAAIIRPGYGAWVKTQESVPVITRSDEKDNMGQAGGSVMNVNRVSNPVGNDVVGAAANAVQVVGETGAVAVLNAAGKKVVISNILGQTIANTTLNSNNASIAAPAGVVIVVVEGENAAKVLVK